ncbi:glycosyltransferase [Roseomonas sp. BN140053]|uniref:glycosyltransferase n=1 Tax=Roseomonas sp. BN140053 TaxID=3391898 RepID=UPI0039E8E429
MTVVVPCYNERANVAPLVAMLAAALENIAWEVVFVDDNSPDGTWGEVKSIAQADPRVRCIRRIGRRGLASAVVEGALSSSAAFVAVIDGDLQHDETRLPLMLEAARNGQYDLVVGSRHVAGGDTAGLANAWRQHLSQAGIRVAQAVLPVRLTDPVSGFFLMPRRLLEELAPRLTTQGFKILLDIVLSAPAPLRVLELPMQFRSRVAGESKLDAQVMVQFLGLLLDKAVGRVIPLRFLSFAAVGGLGILVNLLVLQFGSALDLPFDQAQALGTAVAMATNFKLNNAVTYRDRRLKGAAFWRGLVLFMVLCGAGAAANVGVAHMLVEQSGWTLASLAGALLSVVWNYAISSTLVWPAR